MMCVVDAEEISRRIREHVEVRQSRDNMVFQIEELQHRVSDHRRQLDDMKSQAKCVAQQPARRSPHRPLAPPTPPPYNPLPELPATARPYSVCSSWCEPFLEGPEAVCTPGQGRPGPPIVSASPRSDWPLLTSAAPFRVGGWGRWCRCDKDSVVLALEQRAGRAEAKLRDMEMQLQAALHSASDTKRHEAAAVSETASLKARVDGLTAALAAAKADAERQGKVCGQSAPAASPPPPTHTQCT